MIFFPFLTNEYEQHPEKPLAPQRLVDCQEMFRVNCHGAAVSVER